MTGRSFLVNAAGMQSPYVAVLPVFTGTEASGALVLTGDARDPVHGAG